VVEECEGLLHELLGLPKINNKSLGIRLATQHHGYDGTVAMETPALRGMPGQKMAVVKIETIILEN
jgi:hypothetical protein